jgi:Fe-S cluster assembly iron-binding protein IscA
MALDESKDTDEVFTVDGFDYIVDKDFLNEAKPIKVDYLDIGFKVTSSLVLDAGGCGSCGSSGSCG